MKITSFLKSLALCAFAALVSPVVRASSVDWTPQPVTDSNLSNPADQTTVSTAGTLVAAVNVGGSAVTVNGVPFADGSGSINLPSCNWSVPGITYGNNFSSYYTTTGSGSPINSSDAWLSGGKYGNNAGNVGTLNLLNLTVGHQYAVQLFFADIRPGNNGYKVIVDGGTANQFGFNSGGSYGYLAMNGVFTATASSQAITMRDVTAADAAGNTHINAFQFRDLGLSTIAATPTFSLPAGTYVGTQTVTINSTTPDSTLYYTTNGSTPTNASPSGPSGLALDVFAGTTVTIKAYSHLDGYTDSPVASATYTALATASGVWTNPAGGSWTTAANWQGSVIALGETADFSTLSLTADRSITLDGARTVATLLFDDQNAINHVWTLNAGSAGPLTLDAGGNVPYITTNTPVIINAELAGTHGLAKDGSEPLTLSGANSYTGTTYVDAGLLTVTNLTAYRSSTTLASGTTFKADVTADVSASNSFNITGSGTLVKTGAGIWGIGAAGRVGISLGAGGLIDIQQGMIQTGNHQQSWTGNQGSLNIAAGATVDVPAENLSADALTGGGSITNSYAPSGARTVTVGVADGSGTFSGVIGSGGLLALTKSGTGTQILTGANTYTNTTIINGGVLRIDGNNSAATGTVTVNNTGTLGGTGTVGGAISVVNGGTLSPGASIGTLTANNGVTFASGSTFAAEINTDTITADLLAITGNLNFGNATLAVTNLGTTVPANGTKFTVATYTGTLTGTFNGLPEGSTVTLGSTAYIVRYADGGKNVTLTVGAGGTFDNWAALNGVTGGINGDSDKDGVSNGIEYFMSQSGTGFTALPGVVTTAGVRTVTWTKGAEYTGIYGTNFVVETSATLNGVWATETVGGTVAITGNSVTYTFPVGPVANFVRLKVTGP